MAATGKIEKINRQSTREQPRSKWTTPKLVVYGNVATLTQGVNGSNNDPGQGNQTKRGNG
ncbi:MAG TPA: hypothetical protein VEU51_17525 [Candidatus Acidoferrales bacterium]|nr:hypothetical protein [Candidatus Acidoferrales bacterium]